MQIFDKNLKLVTVVVPYYNHEKYIEECIRSIVNQTYKNIEVIVIDDGSTDFGYKIIEKLQDEFHFVFIRKKNEGLCATLNLGLSLASGDIFCCVASDDVWLPEKVENQLAMMLTHDMKVCSANCQVIDSYGNVIKKQQKKLNNTIQTYTFDDVILNKHFIPASNLMWDISTLRSIGGYSITTKLEDYDTLLKVTSSGVPIYTLNHVLSKYRKHSSNTSNDVDMLLRETVILLEMYKSSNLHSRALVFSKLIWLSSKGKSMLLIYTYLKHGSIKDFTRVIKLFAKALFLHVKQFDCKN